MSTDLTRLLAETDAILLDFDGPVCSIFAGYPAPKIAAELVELLRRQGVALPQQLSSETDPLEVLRRAGTTGDMATTRAVDDALCAAELRAAESASPTPYSREVIVAAWQTGIPVAVVSSNSADAVTAYLASHRLAGYVSPIVGRADIQAGKVAGVRTIGYANRPAKVGVFRKAGADAVFESMGLLAGGLITDASD